MADTLVFDEFVKTRSPHLLRIAYLLTRDHNHAEDLLQTALARSWSAWRRIDDNPEPYVRRVLVNTYSSWRGRRWHGELPSETLPEMALTAPQSEIDNRDEVWRALGRLPHQQRAVLVLRYFEDMSELQIAEALGISTGTVKSHASKGIANLRGDETLRQLDIDVPAAAEGTERLAGVHARIRSQRVRRIATAAVAGVAAVVILLALLAMPSLHLKAAPLPPATPLPAGSYYQGSRVVAAVAAKSNGTATLTWTPTSTDQHLLMRCVWPDNARSVETVFSGSAVILDGPQCSQSTAYEMQSVNIEPDQVGHPLTITARLVARNLGNQAIPVPSDGVIYLGVSADVTFEKYPLPTRPATLVPVDHSYHDPETPFSSVPTAVVSPGRPTSIRLMPGIYDVHVVSQTPGSISIAAAGQPTTVSTFWDYSATPVDDTNLQIGGITGYTPITVVIATQNLTGDWLVAFSLRITR